MNDNLMFWVEWIKLTYDQQIRLLNHVTDDNMLYEMAITSGGSRSNDLIGNVVYGIKDDTLVVKLAAEILPRCAESIVDRLGKSAWMLFDNNITSLRISFEDELMTNIMHGMNLDRLSSFCSANIYPAVRMCAFDNVVLRMTDAVDDNDIAKHDQCLTLLQSMVMTEIESDTRDRMQSLLDGLTEDHI